MRLKREEDICPYFKDAGPGLDYLGVYKKVLGHGHIQVEKIDLGLDQSEEEYFAEYGGDVRAEDEYELEDEDY